MKQKIQTNNSTKTNKLKRAIAAIAFALLLVLVAGLALQLFMPAGKKVSDWFDKIKVPVVDERALIEVGDEITVLYGNTSKTDEEVVEMLDSLDWSGAQSEYGGSVRELTLCTFENVTYPVNGVSWQPQMYVYSANGYYSISFPTDLDGSAEIIWSSDGGWKMSPLFAGTVFTVSAVYQQDLWKDYIAKETFASEIDTPVVIQRSLIAAGDEVTAFYCNSNKSIEEVADMLKDLPWYNSEVSSGGSTRHLVLCSFGEGTQLIAVRYVSTETYSIFLVTSENEWKLVWAQESGGNGVIGNHNAGWQTPCPCTFAPALTVSAVSNQYYWKYFISKVPFDNV